MKLNRVFKDGTETMKIIGTDDKRELSNIITGGKRFVIVNDLPYLYEDGRTFRMKIDANGFTIGEEVSFRNIDLGKSYSEIELKAKQTFKSLNSIDLEKEHQEMEQ